MSDLTLLGNQVRTPVRQLETFPAPSSVQRVTLRSDEFTSLCPVTGQPDFQTVEIVYSPDQSCLESKSLKLYLWSFREEGVFCEALAEQIAFDIMEAVSPFWCEVTISQKPRGGVSIIATARLYQGGQDPPDQSVSESAPS